MESLYRAMDSSVVFGGKVVAGRLCAYVIEYWSGTCTRAPACLFNIFPRCRLCWNANYQGQNYLCSDSYEEKLLVVASTLFVLKNLPLSLLETRGISSTQSNLLDATSRQRNRILPPQSSFVCIYSGANTFLSDLCLLLCCYSCVHLNQLCNMNLWAFVPKLQSHIKDW